ncbi:MAG TPA: choline ABC transporter permease [Firmicutes bacterium]|jgi:osmoprotectant transport system permease protein|nr:choline ABC transporter permease [Bacillota bacterium]
MSFFEFLQVYQSKIWLEFVQHLRIITISIPIAILISAPLGFLISSRPKLAKIVLNFASILMTIPSLALFGIMVVVLAPFKLGLGMTPAVVAISVYSILPITRNIYTALNQVSPSIVEAAVGLGMSRGQILSQIKIPLSVPVIMAGVRNAVILGVSVATFASLVGAGGLGSLIFSGISRTNLKMVVVGALLVSFLGIVVNYLFLILEDALTPAGLKIKN